ncbi:hypothetical protein [Phenylobacterium sp.]|uniref:hypothetical protein n=1 Tax=Phenylobacterium sp. TaxID=1871053 RepID=UPI002F92448A
MTERKLRVVDGDVVYDLGRRPESVPERARRLMHEAQVLACEEVEQLRASLGESLRQAEAIRDGGDIFPVGVREQARQLAEALPLAMQTLQALSERRLREITGAPVPPVWRGG